jgi:sugar phosphate permease
VFQVKYQSQFSSSLIDQIDKSMLFMQNTDAQLLYLASIANAVLRKAFTMASIFIATDLSLSKAELGIISSNFSIGYGITKLMSGILCDVIDPRIFLVAGISIGSMLLLSIPSFHSFAIINVIYLSSGALFGLCNPALNKLTINSISEERIGEIWSFSTAFGNIGYLLSPFLFLSLRQTFQENACRILGTIGIATACHIWFAPRHASTGSLDRGEQKMSSSPIQWLDLRLLARSLIRIDIWILIIANAVTIFVLKAFADWIGMIILFCNQSWSPISI